MSTLDWILVLGFAGVGALCTLLLCALVLASRDDDARWEDTQAEQRAKVEGARAVVEAESFLADKAAR